MAQGIEFHATIDFSKLLFCPDMVIYFMEGGEEYQFVFIVFIISTGTVHIKIMRPNYKGKS